MIKSYYFRKNKIHVKDYDGTSRVLDLNISNLSRMISDLDSQIKLPVETLIENENNEYRKYTNILGGVTIMEMILASLVVLSFAKASYIGLYTTISLSILLILSTTIVSVICVKKIRDARIQYKIYEGREILVEKYNLLLGKMNTKLADAY